MSIQYILIHFTIHTFSSSEENIKSDPIGSDLTFQIPIKPLSQIPINPLPQIPINPLHQYPFNSLAQIPSNTLHQILIKNVNTMCINSLYNTYIPNTY